MQNACFTPPERADPDSTDRTKPKAVATIVSWSVIGHDRVAGKLVDGESGRHCRVITSPVIRVHLLPGDGKALALTRSGTMYILVHPAFDASQAQDFLDFKAKPLGLRGSIGTGKRLDLPSAEDEPTRVISTSAKPPQG
jgi:hypothetical protein